MPKSECKFEVFKDAADEWRWRFISANGRIVATSGEGYKNREDCITGLSLVRRFSTDAAYVVVET